MELHELGMALATERIAEPRREAEHAAVPGRPIGSGPGAHNRRLGGTPVDRERGTALLTRSNEHLLPHHHRREATQSGPPPARPTSPPKQARQRRHRRAVLLQYRHPMAGVALLAS
jgi:hypothetical protein